MGRGPGEPPMTIDEAKIVWDMAYRFWPRAAVFRYFARRPTDGHVYGCAITSPEELARTTDWADANHYNSYWQPNPTLKDHATRCSAADIMSWRYFMLDVDPVTADAAPAVAARHAYEDIGKPLFLLNADVTVINSGRGMQVLYPMIGEPDYTATRAMAFWLNALKKSLKRRKLDFGCTIDTSCSDLPRVMRMPFTINQKTLNRSFIVREATELNHELAGKLTSLAPEHVFKMPEPSVPTGTLTWWMEYIPHLTVRARKFLEAGDEETQRHYSAAACLLSLIEQGATEPQCLAALGHGAQLCDPPLPQGEVVDMVTRKFR